jgi:DNA-binding XRE family transcriptional regulator
VADFMAMAAVFEQATLAANLDVARHTHGRKPWWRTCLAIATTLRRC